MIASKFESQLGLFGRKRYGLHFVHPPVATEPPALNFQVVAFAFTGSCFVDHVLVAGDERTGCTRIDWHIELMKVDLQCAGLELVNSQNFERAIQVRTIGQREVVRSEVACLMEKNCVIK